MRIRTLSTIIGVILSLTACSTVQVGGGSSPVSGSAGESGNAQGGAPQLVQCAAPVGTIALVESQIPGLAQLGLSSPVPLIRLMAAQSHCFTVVERGQALTRMNEERQLAQSGVLQQGSNIGQGQMVAADYLITPNVVFSERDAGGAGSALGAIVPGLWGTAASAVAAGVRFREAQALLAVTDTRSGVQTAIAEGRAKASDLGGGLGLGSIAGFGALGGYSNTNQGKVIAGAFLHSFNQLVEQIRVLPNR
jgi:hypothetical protein